MFGWITHAFAGFAAELRKGARAHIARKIDLII
jgi:hypothetical protein